MLAREAEAMDVHVLAFHAGYRCRHAGACCTAGWPIPIEADRLARLRAAMANGELQTVAAVERPFIEAAQDGPDSAALVATAQRRCVFHDSTGACAIHTAMGHDALPLACRQFPRVSVIDPRGVSVTLSHYCPTAAALLGDDTGARERSPINIAVNPPAFPANGEYVGLEARTALPPLLRPGMLMDWESWWELERLSVDMLVNSPDAPDRTLGRIRGVVALLERWHPSDGPLLSAVRDGFTRALVLPAPASSVLMKAAIEAVPAASRAGTRWSQNVTTPDVPTRRFLAAHAFANWTIHLGQGLAAWRRSIETAHAFITASAGVRHADLVLRHLIDPSAFATKLSRVPF